MEDSKTEDLEISDAFVDSYFDDDYDIEKELFHLEDKQMLVCVTDVIDKASRFIFAEDLVSYISSEFHSLVYSKKVENGSKTLFSPFNETIKHAVHLIRLQINKQNCPSFEIIETLSKSYNKIYEKFVDAVLEHYSEKGLKAGVFLYLCVYFAELALKCYRPDFEEILDFAVYAIVDAFCMLTEGRFELNNFAKTISCELEDRSFYLDLWPLWHTQVEILDEQHPIYGKPFVGKYFFSPENNVEVIRTSLEHLKLADKSNKCEVINNLEFSIDKTMEHNKKDLLAKYLNSLKRLQLIDKYKLCEAVNNLEFAINKVMENRYKDVGKYRASLEQLLLMDKSETCGAISNSECSNNKICENGRENKVEEILSSIQQLKLADKFDECEVKSNLEFVKNDIVENSKMDEFEKCITSLEMFVDVYNMCEAISNLEFAINKIMENNQKNDAEKYRAALELQLIGESGKCEAISNPKFIINKIVENSKKNEVEKNRAFIEQLKLIEKFKGEAISNLTFMNKDIGSNKEFELHEYLVALQRLELAEKSVKCGCSSNLDFAKTINSGNSKNEMEYKTALEQLHLTNKCKKCEVINSLELAINEGMECNHDGLLKYRTALEQLKLVEKSDKCETVSNLECALNEVMDNNTENKLEEYQSALKELKHVDKLKNYEVMSNLVLDVNKIDEECQENVVQNRAVLEQMKFLDNPMECDVKNNLEFAVNKNMENLLKSVGSNEKKISGSEDRSKTFDLLIDELCFIESAIESKISGDIMQEILSIVSFEASLFSSIYIPPDNQQNLDGQDQKLSQNEKGSIELISDNFDESKAENYLQAAVGLNSEFKGNERKLEDSSYLIDDKDVKFPNNESKEYEFEKERLISQTSTVKSDKNSISKVAVHFTQFELENMTNDTSAISHAITLGQNVQKYIENNAEISTISNSELPQEENERKSEVSSASLENKDLKFTNFESTGLDLPHDQLISQSLQKYIENNAEIPTISNPELPQEENDRKAEVSSAILENKDLKFTIFESIGLDFPQDQLISQSLAENCDKNTSEQLAENFTILNDSETNDCNFSVDYKPVVQVDDKQIVDCLVFYQQGEIHEEKLKILKGASLLFAEDLVKYTAKEFYGISYSESKFGEIRHFFSNQFNETLKYIAHFIHDECENVNSMAFKIISNLKEERTDWYRKYVATLLRQFVEDGMNADVFLYYCFHFTELASKLYKLGLLEILDFAVCSILDAFCLLKDDWNDFNVAVENVLKLFETRKDKKNNLLCFYYVDNLERECVNTICDLLKSYTEQKIEDICLNYFMTFNIDEPTKQSNKLEISNTDCDILEQNET